MDLQSTSNFGYRNEAIDVFRGMLIILVIIGHFAEILDRTNFVTWFGFGFRMPIFIALTGYMFKLERARSSTLPAFLGKYYHRLILPWLIASAFYMISSGGMNWSTPWQMLARPPFHLWFVPVIMAFMLAARASRHDQATMLALAIPVSIGAMYFFGVGHGIDHHFTWMPDRRYFTFPVYFAFGMWLATQPTHPERLAATLAVACLGLIWWSMLYHQPDAPAEVAAKLMLCLPLISLLPWISRLDIRSRLLSVVGRNTLFLYLWHPLVFGLIALAGFWGLSMLVLTLLSMMAAWLILSRNATASLLLGIEPRGPQRAASGKREGEAIAGEAAN